MRVETDDIKGSAQWCAGPLTFSAMRRPPFGPVSVTVSDSFTKPLGIVPASIGLEPSEVGALGQLPDVAVLAAAASFASAVWNLDGFSVDRSDACGIVASAVSHVSGCRYLVRFVAQSPYTGADVPLLVCVRSSR